MAELKRKKNHAYLKHLDPWEITVKHRFSCHQGFSISTNSSSDRKGQGEKPRGHSEAPDNLLRKPGLGAQEPWEQ